MNRITGVFAVTCIFAFSVISDFYSFNLPRLEGGTKSVSGFQGRKVLVTILPVTRTNSTDSLLSVIDSLGTVNNSTLGIIAVPSFEHGFEIEQRDSLLAWYRSKLSDSIVITDGLYTMMSSGTQQSPLFEWLTHKDQNGHFEAEISGIGQKYFINETGELYAVLGPEVKYGGGTVRKMLEQ